MIKQAGYTIRYLSMVYEIKSLFIDSLNESSSAMSNPVAIRHMCRQEI
jgi:hypothetical protein